MTGAARTGSRNVLSIPPGAAFLTTFVHQFLAGRVVAAFPGDGGPLALSRARIFVPTRRAALALAGEFAAQIEQPAILLPQIIPLGAMDAAETAALFDMDSPMPGRPPVIGEIERRLVLAEMIQAWGQNIRGAIRSFDGEHFDIDPGESMLVTAAPAQAFHLAGELAALIDEMTIENVDPSRLRRLAPENFDKYWAITLQFLDIALTQWPEHLREHGLEDRATRQAALIEDEIRRLGVHAIQADDGHGPVEPSIVLGSTGTNAATARLIAAIAALPSGAVVLPGLERDMDDLSWDAIAASDEPAAAHPQAAMHRLLRTIGIARSDVRECGGMDQQARARMDFTREALRPAQTTGHWRQWRQDRAAADIAEALQGVVLIDAADERLEALAVALALREALEIPGRTAAFITPDRDLSRRVKSELLRWDVEVDDSGGDPLAQEPAGIFARLILDCAGERPAASALLALLDHECVRLGIAKAEFERLRALAEVSVFRGVGCDIDQPGIALRIAREAAGEPHAHASRKAIAESDWPEIELLLTRLRDALTPLRSLAGDRNFRDWFAAHQACVANLLQHAPEETPGGAGPDFESLELLFDSFLACAERRFHLSLEGYAALFAAAAGETIVRGPRRAHSRIKILGLLEARLIPADLKILGGLDETIWPPAARTDAFLNRPMRAALGLSAPERRIGQTAHDFAEAFGAREVMLTRAKKRAGAPTAPSRFVLRLEALAGAENWRECAGRGAAYLRLAHMLDTPVAPVRPARRPWPRPALHLRPVSLSVTEIETWRRDPYAIHARHILRLEPLDELDAEDGPAEYGSRLHDVLAEYHHWRDARGNPDAAATAIVEMARTQFAAQLAAPDFATFKWDRLCAYLRAFVGWDEGRRGQAGIILAEQSGRLEIRLGDEAIFTLRGRADRFEINGRKAVIIDFKTGNPPTGKAIAAGFSPQLTLEAAMLECGAFAGVAAGVTVEAAEYVKIGGPDEVKVQTVGSAKTKPLPQLVAEHYAGLQQMALQFRREETGYPPRPFPQYINRYGAYDHLARVKEWSTGAGEGGEA